jgi:hypothetical protein
VDDRGRIAISIGLGAVLGGVVGYLFLTERGRELRVDIEPRFNELLGEVDRLRTTFDRTRTAVSEGLRSFNQLMNDAPPQTAASAASAAWAKDEPQGHTH